MIAAFSAGYAFRGERVRSQAVSAVLLSVREEPRTLPHARCDCAECQWVAKAMRN